MRNSTGIAVIVAATLAASALGGCGGGGGGLAAAPPPAASFDLQAGIAGLVMSGQTSSIALSGTANNGGTSVPFTGSGTLTLSPAASATFNGEGTLAQTEVTSGTLSVSGQSLLYGPISVVDYYSTGDNAFIGETGSNEYDVAQTAFTYPTTVMVGSSGILGTTNNYTDSSMAVPQGTTQVSYAVTAAAGSSTTVMVAVTNQVYDTQNTLVETDVTNYSLTDSGVLSLVSPPVQNSSGMLTVTAQ